MTHRIDVASNHLVNVIAGEIGGITQPTVNARELHAFLENGSLFANWIKARIEKFGFEESQDFRIDLEKTKTIRVYQGGERIGTSTRTDYHLTLDMAKELSMVENNAKGREARRYFIDMERQALAAAGQQPQTIAGQTIGMDGFHVLGALVAGKLRALPSPARSRARARLWSQVHTAFNVRSAQDIPADQFDAARSFVAAYTFQGELLEAERTRSKPALELHYPLEDWMKACRHVTPIQLGDQFNGVSVPVAALIGDYFDSPSPTLLLLRKLREAGYNVDACRMEVQALKHHLCTFDTMADRFAVVRKHAEAFRIR